MPQKWTDRRTEGRTHGRTFWLIERIGPEGQFFEKMTTRKTIQQKQQKKDNTMNTAATKATNIETTVWTCLLCTLRTPFIMQNCHNFWSNDAIVMSFGEGQHIYLKFKELFINIWAWRQGCTTFHRVCKKSWTILWKYTLASQSYVERPLSLFET